jgi:hypothetical protein
LNQQPQPGGGGGGIRAVLEALPGRLPAHGGIRISAWLDQGQLAGPVKVALIRLPANTLDNLELDSHTPIRADLLEHAAAQLKLDRGRVELAIEYTREQDGTPKLRWLDISWIE